MRKGVFLQSRRTPGTTKRTNCQKKAGKHCTVTDNFFAVKNRKSCFALCNKLTHSFVNSRFHSFFFQNTHYHVFPRFTFVFQRIRSSTERSLSHLVRKHRSTTATSKTTQHVQSVHFVNYHYCINNNTTTSESEPFKKIHWSSPGIRREMPQNRVSDDSLCDAERGERCR